MTGARLAMLSQAQRDRLAHLDLRVRFVGLVGRQDLVDRFGIQSAAASRDLSLYREHAPKNLEYDAKAKVYRATADFRPLFEFPVERILAWLSDGYGDVEPVRSKGIVAYQGSGPTDNIDLEALSILTRAMRRGAAVEVAYRGLSTGLTTHEIVPHALADSGLRWHVRAFDRRTHAFRDFALGRIDDARVVAGDVEECERPDQDYQWNRITELELVPHPANVQHPDTVEREYRMEGGVLKVLARAAVVGYLLRRWRVDCTEDHGLKGGEYHLWLRNRPALYGIDNLALAPGYSEPSKEW